MPIISLAIQKGGSGKTTTAINLAAALRRMGRSVLLVDMDPQANLTHSLGLTEEVEPSIYHLLKTEMDGDAADLTTIIQETKSGLHLAPASLELAGAELELVSVYGREQLIKRMLQPLRDQYDYILLDCPPAIGMLTVNALVASEYVLLPLQAEFLPFRGLQSFMTHFQRLQRTLNPDLIILGLVLSRFDPRIVVHRDIRARLQEDYPGMLFATSIRTNIALSAAQQQGLDIFSFEATSNGAEDYLFLAHEVDQRINSS